VLLSTFQPLPAVDHAYLHGLTRHLWGQITASSALSGESVWSVLGKTVKHGLLRRPYTSPFRVMEYPTLLSKEALQGLRWEDLLDNLSLVAEQAPLPPGKRSHAQGVAFAYYDYVFYAGDSSDDIDPLNSQPVWELALQIPSYVMLDGGVSRGLARRAFSDLLPHEIRTRRSKGTGHFFYKQLFLRNRNYLREQLADGLLVREKYLDRDKLLTCFASEDPTLTIAPGGFLTYLAAEIWLQEWSSAQRNVTSRSLLQSAAV
jgi:asparagine synthase (glutamine-hydrolysing)